MLGQFENLPAVIQAYMQKPTEDAKRRRFPVGHRNVASAIGSVIQRNPLK